MAGYQDKHPGLVHKFCVQSIIFMFLIDLLWIILFCSVWSHDENEKDYWKNLTSLHNFIYYCAYAEVALSVIIAILLIKDYKNQYGSALNPFNFNYKTDTNALSAQDDGFNNLGY